MASQLDTELGKLKGAIIKIGGLAETQVFEAMKALISGPSAETSGVKKNENKIDKLDVKIDEICQGVFALQQPVASDLRFIMSAMQISNEIERIGDLAVSVIKKSKNISEKHNLVTDNNIGEIASDVETITVKTNQCFQTLEEGILGEIFILNNSIRHKSNDAIHSIVAEMKRDSNTVVSGTNLIIILKHMERIAEHCTNIGEALYFVINAKIIKHEKFTDKK
jgi:phosphate transport system protein